MVYGTAYIGIHNPTPQVHRKSWRSHIPNGFAGADGRRLHVLRVVNPREAAMARQNFEMYARGAGITRTAKRLNAGAVPVLRQIPRG